MVRVSSVRPPPALSARHAPLALARGTRRARRPPIRCRSSRRARPPRPAGTPPARRSPDGAATTGASRSLCSRPRSRRQSGRPRDHPATGGGVRRIHVPPAVGVRRRHAEPGHRQHHPVPLERPAGRRIRSPRPVASTVPPRRKNGTSDPTAAATSSSRRGLAGGAHHNRNARSADAASLLAPPSPAAAGIALADRHGERRPDRRTAPGRARAPRRRSRPDCPDRGAPRTRRNGPSAGPRRAAIDSVSCSATDCRIVDTSWKPSARRPQHPQVQVDLGRCANLHATGEAPAGHGLAAASPAGRRHLLQRRGAAQPGKGDRHVTRRHVDLERGRMQSVTFMLTRDSVAVQVGSPPRGPSTRMPVAGAAARARAPRTPRSGRPGRPAATTCAPSAPRRYAVAPPCSSTATDPSGYRRAATATGGPAPDTRSATRIRRREPGPDRPARTAPPPAGRRAPPACRAAAAGSRDRRAPRTRTAARRTGRGPRCATSRGAPPPPACACGAASCRPTARRARAGTPSYGRRGTAPRRVPRTRRSRTAARPRRPAPRCRDARARRPPPAARRRTQGFEGAGVRREHRSGTGCSRSRLSIETALRVAMILRSIAAGSISSPSPSSAAPPGGDGLGVPLEPVEQVAEMVLDHGVALQLIAGRAQRGLGADRADRA